MSYKKSHEAIALLSPEEYWVTQENGTERPGTGKLLYNKETGEGSVQILESIKSESKLMIADVFQDWANELRWEYDKAIAKYFNDLKDKQGKTK